MKKILARDHRRFSFKRKANQVTYLDKAETMQVRLEIEDEAMLEQLKMIDLTEDDVKLAKAIQPLIIEHVKDIVATFYETITDVKHLKNIIIHNSTLERLRQTLEVHLIEMFSGDVDQAFIDKRIRIANIHYKIGLEPKWYMGAFQNLQSSLIHIVNQHITHREENERVIQMVTKILNIEQQLVLEAYEAENLRQRQQQEDEIKQDLKAKIIAVCEDMANITERTNAALQELVASSEVINHSVSRGSDASKGTQQLAQEGQGKLLELKARIAAILERANNLQDSVVQLDQSVEEIGEVNRIVQSIANDTNLLSLNSSIEAARAGEHGAGFGVVSQEIRKLSDRTKASVQQIEDYIDQTKSLTDLVVAVIADVHHIVREGQQESEAADLTFKQILDSMSANLDDVEKIEDGMASLVDNIRQISDAMEEVAVSAETLYVAVENL